MLIYGELILGSVGAVPVKSAGPSSLSNIFGGVGTVNDPPLGIGRGFVGP